MSQRSLSLFPSLFLFFLAAAAATLLSGCGGDARPLPRGKSILFISIDTLRADYLGCYGNEGGHTPHIDSLARESVLFENCAAPIATTFPSHASMFTGLYPRFHGLRWNGQSLGDEATTLAELLEGRGYDTAAFVALQAMIDRGGLGQGFRWKSGKVRKRTRGERVRSGRDVNRLAMDWLSRRGKGARPFFLWVHYYEPHGPYPVTPYAEKVMNAAGYEGPFRKGADWELIRANIGLLGEPVHRDAIRALYAGRVREADSCVGELLSFLDERGLGGKTTVILTADHGQILGESYDAGPRFGHGPILFEEALRVPLLIRDKGRFAPRRAPERVGLVDLTPAVLDLSDAAEPEGGQGRSLVPACEGRPLEPRIYAAEIRVEPPGSGDSRFRDRVALYEKNMKVIFPDLEIFDLSLEEPEKRSLDAARWTGLIDRLRPVADRFLGHGGAGEGSPENLTPEDIAELKALGYLR